jgi:hypothetical protein
MPHAAVCDLLEPWAHGTVVRATRYPRYFNLNLVRVEEDPAMSVEELAAFADEALAGLGHRRLDFDLVDAAEPLRATFLAQGWRARRLLWMRHEVPPPPDPTSPSRRFPTTPWTTCASPGTGRSFRTRIPPTTTPRRARSPCAS